MQIYYLFFGRLIPTEPLETWEEVAELSKTEGAVLAVDANPTIGGIESRVRYYHLGYHISLQGFSLNIELPGKHPNGIILE